MSEQNSENHSSFYKKHELTITCIVLTLLIILPIIAIVIDESEQPIHSDPFIVFIITCILGIISTIVFYVFWRMIYIKNKTANNDI